MSFPLMAAFGLPLQSLLQFSIHLVESNDVRYRPIAFFDVPCAGTEGHSQHDG